MPYVLLKERPFVSSYFEGARDHVHGPRGDACKQIAGDIGIAETDC